jgi:diguanylate cyclase (GGDEF)-like protein
MVQSIDLDFPCTPEPLNSPFYIKRFPAEEIAVKAIHKGGSVIRIRAPRKMGKTSFALRLIQEAQVSGYRTVYLDFQQAEDAVFTSLDKFLRWFCTNISWQLEILPMLDEYWDEDMGSKVSCTIYLQSYLLQRISTPLVLVLNEVNRIFDYPYIAKDFLSLLRSWHEEAKQNALWQKLRLVIVHSTEVYINLNINQSPFNVGVTINLPEFTSEQIQDLAEQHRLNWRDEVGKGYAFYLKAMVGGNPYLVRLALYHLLQYPETSLEELLKAAPTMAGIYSNHLLSILAKIKENPELITAIQQLVNAGGKAELNHILAYKLESLGIVKLAGNECYITCELYRQYFSGQKWEESFWQEKLVQLQEQNQELQRLANLDHLTQTANKRYFDKYLEQVWQSCAFGKHPLSLIKIEIDYFKLYNETCGQEAGDDCLQQIARAISDCVKFESSLVARYRGKDFVVVLPRKKANFALRVAELIRERVRRLAIYYDSSIYGGLSNIVTISLGVACTIPHAQHSPSILIDAADEALHHSIREGRNCTTISSELNYGDCND